MQAAELCYNFFYRSMHAVDYLLLSLFYAKIDIAL